MKVKFFLAFALYFHNFLAEGENSLLFSALLTTFKDCSLIYFHLENLDKNSHAKHDQNDDPHLLPNLHKRFGETAIFQLKVLTFPFLQSGIAQTSNLAANTFKFAKCTVLIFMREHVQFALDVYIRKGIFQGRTDFVWFLNTNREAELHEENHYLWLVHSRKPSIYLEIRDFSQILMICLPCFSAFPDEKQSLLPMEEAGLKTMQTVEQIWLTMHRNLHRTVIKYWGQQPITQISDYIYPDHSAPCAFFPRKTRYLLATECAMVLLSIKKNFSMLGEDNKNYVYIHSVVKSRILLDAISTSVTLQDRELVLNHGIEYTAFGFITLHDKKDLIRNPLKMTEILTPFPTWTWPVIVSVGFTTSICFYCNSESIRPIRVSKLLDSFYAISILLVDQVAGKLPWKDDVTNRAIWFAWGLFCLVVSNAYKGFIFSELAITETPKTPQTLDELAQSNLKTITLEWFDNITGDVSLPVLTTKILSNEILIETDHARRSMFQQLQSSIEWFPVTYDELTAQISLSKTIEIGGRLLRIEKKLAIMDPIKNLNLLKALLEDVDVFWVSKVISETGLGHQDAWFATYNYLHPILSRGLGTLHESGMFDLWKRFHSLIIEKDHKYLVRIAVGKSPNKDENHKGENEISKSVYLKILIIFLVSHASSMIMFMMEVTSRIGKISKISLF